MVTKKNNKQLSFKKSEHTFVHSNQLVEAHYDDVLSYWEMYIFSKMCTMIDPQDTDFKHYKIYIKDILGHVDVNKSGQSYKYVVEAAKRLLDRQISVQHINDEGKKMTVYTRLVSSVYGFDEPDENDALYILLTFAPELKPLLLQLKENFTILDLDVFKNLKTPTSVRLYQLLTSHLWKAEKRVEYNLDELKKKLGVADKYEQYGPFKNYILNEAKTKLAENTNLSFTYSEVKTGKKITSIIFFLRDKNEKEQIEKLLPQTILAPIEDIDTFDEQDKLITELFPIVISQFGLGLKTFTQLVMVHTEGDIREAVKVTLKAQKAGKIENLAGFFVKAVQEHYSAAPQKVEQSQKQAIAKQRAQEVENKELEKQQRAHETKKQAFLQEDKRILALIVLDKALEQEAIAHIQRTSTIYDTHKSLSENLQNPSIKAAFHLAVKKLRPEAF
jgi:plasmid replication initiation protein